MLITTIRYGRTVNKGNYESEKLEVEIIPEQGQTAEAALDEVRAYVDSKVTGATAPPAKTKSTAPPLASEPKAGGVDPPPTTKPPAAKTPKAAAKTTTPPLAEHDTAKHAKRGKSPAQRAETEHGKELQYVLDSWTLAEVAQRFNHLRLNYALRFDESGEWEAACKKVAARWRDLVNAIVARGDAVDLEAKEIFTAATKSEMNYIQHGFRLETDALVSEAA